jgi:hypothetical protein
MGALTWPIRAIGHGRPETGEEGTWRGAPTAAMPRPIVAGVSDAAVYSNPVSGIARGRALPGAPSQPPVAAPVGRALQPSGRGHRRTVDAVLPTIDGVRCPRSVHSVGRANRRGGSTRSLVVEPRTTHGTMPTPTQTAISPEPLTLIATLDRSHVDLPARQRFDRLLEASQVLQPTNLIVRRACNEAQGSLD